MKFYNIKSGESLTYTDPMQIQALLSMGDMSANASAGQDFGWRIDAGLKAQIEYVKENPNFMAEIAKSEQIPFEALEDSHILSYLQRQAQSLDETNVNSGVREMVKKSQEAYDKKVEKARKELEEQKRADVGTTTNTVGTAKKASTASAVTTAKK